MKQSTYLRDISYDQRTKRLTVEFTDGAIIVYLNVHPRTFAAIDSAKKSAGAKFAQLMGSHEFDIVRSAAWVRSTNPE